MVKKDTPEWEEWTKKLKGFRERVEDLIDKSGKTKTQIAREMGVSPQCFGYWIHQEKGQMNTYTAWRLARYFGVTIDYLLTGRTVISKKRPLPPVREYQTLGGAKRDTSDTRDERRPGSLPLG
jgi:DNA-binding XRE family transcriptional regulator